MPYCWKTEFYVIENGHDAIAWCETLDEARSVAADNSNVTRIDKVRHYMDDVETVWENDDEA